jgi:hypothetical protein
MSVVDHDVQCPPGMSPWGWLGGQAGDPTQWTGTYIMSVLPARSDLATVSKCLPTGLHADPEMVIEGGYPVLLVFGCIADAQNRVYPFLGMNYLEIFSAVPGVYLDTLDSNSGGFAGPFIYPYRGYLSHLLPTILGWLASYPLRVCHEITTPTAPSRSRLRTRFRAATVRERSWRKGTVVS